MNLAGARDGSDEGRLEPAANPPDFGKRNLEDAGHLWTREVAGNESELAHRVFFERPFFEEVVTDLFIAGKQDPAVLSDHGQPGLVRRPAGKMS